MAARLTAADKSRILDLYETRLARYGHDVRTVGWGSQADQWLRFDMLSRDLELSGKRILDVGCGLGDFVRYLDERGASGCHYVGIDLSPKLIGEASSRYAGKDRVFRAGDLLDDDGGEAFDIVLCSGAFSFKTDDNMGLAQQTLRKMFDVAREAVCVNFLSTRVDYQLEKNFHFDPAAMMAFALSLSRRARLYHDYPLYEFTLQILSSPTTKA